MIKPIKDKELTTLLEARADRDRFKTWGGEELLQLFLKFKDRMSSPENDMTYWTSTKTPHKPEELKEIIAKLQKKAEKKSEEQKLIEEGAEKIFEDGKWLVYRITNFEACQTYGAGTRWCITGRNNEGENAYGNRYWRSYTSDGAEFYFFLLKGTNEKYALTVWPDSSKGRLGMGDGSYDLNQADDDPINYIPDAPKVPNLPDVSVEPDFYTNEDEENEDEENEDDGEPAGPPVPPPYTLEPVANPQAMEFPASSLEDALRQFNNATAVSQLRNDLHAIKFGDNKFTVFVFNGTAGGPLMTQRGPGQFSLVVFDNQETLVNWAQQNMPNIQVQNQAAADQPQQIENNDEEENDEEVEESMAKLSKEVKKGENIMEKEVKKPVMESKKLLSEREGTVIYNAIVLLQEYGGEDFEDMNFLLDELGITILYSPAEIKEIKRMMNEGLKKPVMESNEDEDSPYTEVDNQKLGTLGRVILLKDLLDVMWNSVRLTGKGIKGEAVLYKTSDGEYKLDTQKHSFGQEILTIKVKTEDEHTEDADGYPIIKATLTDEPLTEGRKPKITKKPLKEGVRLVYNPREKKTVKEEVKLSFDGEPLPVDIKESNTHTKLRLLRHK
jgi:hypothetical protein